MPLVFLSRKRGKGRVRIPREWYSLLPGQRLAFWVRVDRERRRRGLRKKDWDGTLLSYTVKIKLPEEMLLPL